MTGFRAILVLLVLIGLLGGGAGASAQSGGSAQAAQSGEIQIGVDSFGVGGVVRPGSYAGVRLALTDMGSRVRPVLVRIHTTDPDGDTVYDERAVTLNPGTAQGVWLYPYLPFSFDSNSLLTVTIHEIASENDAGQLPNPGRQIAISRLSPSRVVESRDAILGVIGRSKLGLEQYEVPYPRMPMHPTGTEWQRVVMIDAGQLSARLPDSVLGLSALDVLVWNVGDPGSIRLDTSDAIREWVYGGGHLVVSLPAVGSNWLNETSNPLHDLLPSVTATRRERIDLDRYRALLTESERLPLPSETVVHTFSMPAEELERAGGDTSIVMAGPDRLGLVARRVLGAGAVTLVGFDLSDRALSARLDAQRFWHRVLGYRFDALSLTEMTDLEESSEGRVRFERLSRTMLDSDFASVVDRTGRAGVGVIIGLVLCASYLIVAGPLGFGLLKKKGWHRYSWSAFLGASMVFTLVAWVSSTQARPKNVSVESIVVLDAVYGQSVQRAREWMNVLLPSYGTQAIAIDDGGVGATLGGAITAWDAKPTGAQVVQNRFPDARGYRVDTRTRRSMRVPTRSTVKMFQADWVGSTSLLFPIPEGGSLSVGRDGTISGGLRHQLPVPLENVIVAYVAGQRALGDLGVGSPMLSQARFFRRTSSWAADEVFEFEWAQTAPPGERDTYLERLSSTGQEMSQSLSASGLLKRMEMLTWYPMLQQPEYLRHGQRGAFNTSLERHATHGLDLGVWFTQPCLIVFGEMRDVSSPVPIRVDGRRVESSSRVFVRWVYPLPSRTPSILEGTGS